MRLDERIFELASVVSTLHVRGKVLCSRVSSNR